MIKRIQNVIEGQKKFIVGLLTNKGFIRKSDLIMGMIRVLILCWLVPYLMISVLLFYFSHTKTKRQMSDTIHTSMENAAELCTISVESAIEESKDASYDGVIKESYMDYLGTKDEEQMYTEIYSYLSRKYKYSNVMANTMLLFRNDMSEDYYTYSNRADGTYDNIQYFKQNAMEEVKQIADTLGTGTKLVYLADRLYLLRNVVTSDYEPFATLVMEVNIDHMFSSLENVVWRQDSLIYLDGRLIRNTEQLDEISATYLRKYAEEVALKENILQEGQMTYHYDEKQMISYLSVNVNHQIITYVVKLDEIGILNENNTLIYLYVMVGILLIPLLYATFYYFYTNMSKPISELIHGSEKIEAGEYGYQLEEFHRNEEFGKLIDTFNDMSANLEESFNRIYAEEIAVRDANMQALQSQINPHFLNNTLEIINWKARMSGDKAVSGMVESLGVMMEATMNRKKEPFITIREEMKYVDAYLYIIVQRFGEKFRFEKEIEEDLLDIKIPRLIVQPLVENAVEHGGDAYGNRTGKLRIFGDKRYLFIVVENNGTLQAKDIEKIEKLLNPDTTEENIQNIGIRNVNLRLKMLYGEKSGLTIRDWEDGLIVSTIKIERDKLQV